MECWPYPEEAVTDYSTLIVKMLFEGEGITEPDDFLSRSA